MNEGGKDSSGHLFPSAAGGTGAGPILSGPAGLAGTDGSADRKVGLFTRLQPAGSPFGRNAFILGALPHKTA